MRSEAINLTVDPLEARFGVVSKQLANCAEHGDYAAITIKRSTTGGGQMTFRAARDNVTGHADVFFAIAHAVANEPLDTHRKRKSTWATSQEKKAA